MAATVAISGAFALEETTNMDTFITASLGGAAGDVVTTYQDAENGGLFIICSKASS